MKELYRKDLASHSGPESCDADREDCSEALTGEVAGEVLSHEIREPVRPTPLREAEGNSPQIDKERAVGKRSGGRTSARRESRREGAGDGGREEVGASHSIAEAVERTGYLRSRSVG